MLNKAMVLAVGLAMSSLAFARNPEPAPSSSRSARVDRTAANAAQAAMAPASVDATSTCAYNFVSGGSGTKKFLRYCVTVNGNIVQFESPSGVEHIRIGGFGEGYSVCDFASGLGYHDYAGFGDIDTGSWGAPSLLSLTGTTVKIARTTTDGIWTLTQTIQQSPADASIKVTMALKNNSAISRFVWLARFVDIDANGTTNPNTLGGSNNSAWGYLVNNPPGYGLQLSRAAANAYPGYGFTFSSAAGDTACSIGSGFGTAFTGDGSVYFYHGPTIGGGKTATVKLKYTGL